MKVLYVLSVSWGGIPHYTAELANAVSRYLDVAILKPRDSNDHLFSRNVFVVNAFKPMYFSRRCPASAFSLGNFKGFFSYKNVALIDELKPDIVHFTELYPQSSFFAFLYGIYKKYPTVSTLHAAYKSPLDLLRSENFLYGLVASVVELTKYLVKSDAVIVHTESDKEVLTRRGVSPRRIFVVPHGVYNVFKDFEESGESTEAENRVLFFGYITESKGLEYLIRSVPLIVKEVPDVKIVVAGEGDFSKYLRFIEDLSRFEVYNVFVPNNMVPKLFKRAKVVVLPYVRHRGHSGVLNIARTFGKPVVVTSVGDLPNMVRDGVDGLVVPPRDPESLANAIVRLLKDDGLRKRMEMESLRRAEEFSWDNIARMHIKIYEEVIKERPIVNEGRF